MTDEQEPAVDGPQDPITRIAAAMERIAESLEAIETDTSSIRPALWRLVEAIEDGPR